MWSWESESSRGREFAEMKVFAYSRKLSFLIQKITRNGKGMHHGVSVEAMRLGREWRS